MRGRRGTPGEAEGRETGEGQEDGELEGLRERINERHDEGAEESGQGGRSERSEEASGDRPDGDPQESEAPGNCHASERDLTVEATQSERERQGVERDREADNATGHEGNLENDEEDEELERLREQINEKHEAAEEKDGASAEGEDSQEVEGESAGSASKESQSTDIRDGAGEDTADDNEQVPDAAPKESTEGQAHAQQGSGTGGSDFSPEGENKENRDDEELEHPGELTTENPESGERGHSRGDSGGSEEPDGNGTASPNSEPRLRGEPEDSVDQSEEAEGAAASDAPHEREHTSSPSETAAEKSGEGNDQTCESITSAPEEERGSNPGEQHEDTPNPPNDSFEHNDGVDMEGGQSAETATVKEEETTASRDYEDRLRGSKSVQQTDSWSDDVYAPGEDSSISSEAVRAKGGIGGEDSSPDAEKVQRLENNGLPRDAPSCERTEEETNDPAEKTVTRGQSKCEQSEPKSSRKDPEDVKLGEKTDESNGFGTTMNDEVRFSESVGRSQDTNENPNGQNGPREPGGQRADASRATIPANLEERENPKVWSPTGEVPRVQLGENVPDEGTAEDRQKIESLRPQPNRQEDTPRAEPLKIAVGASDTSSNSIYRESEKRLNPFGSRSTPNEVPEMGNFQVMGGTDEIKKSSIEKFAYSDAASSANLEKAPAGEDEGKRLAGPMDSNIAEKAAQEALNRPRTERLGGSPQPKVSVGKAEISPPKNDVVVKNYLKENGLQPKDNVTNSKFHHVDKLVDIEKISDTVHVDNVKVADRPDTAKQELESRPTVLLARGDTSGDTEAIPVRARRVGSDPPAVRFNITKRWIEKQTATEMDLGKLYRIKGHVDDKYEFEVYRMATRKYIRIHVPLQDDHQLEPGKMYRVKINSMDERALAENQREILDRSKQGLSWRRFRYVEQSQALGEPEEKQKCDEKVLRLAKPEGQEQLAYTVATFVVEAYRKTQTSAQCYFRIDNSSFERETGVRIEQGGSYRIKVRVEGAGEFQRDIRRCTAGQDIRIFVPRQLYDKVEAVEKYKVTINSIEKLRKERGTRQEPISHDSADSIRSLTSTSLLNRDGKQDAFVSNHEPIAEAVVKKLPERFEIGQVSLDLIAKVVHANRDRIYFEIGNRLFRERIGMKLEANQCYKVKGKIEGVCEFEKRLENPMKPQIRISAPVKFENQIKAGEIYRLTVNNIEKFEKKRETWMLSDSVSEGRQWDWKEIASWVDTEGGIGCRTKRGGNYEVAISQKERKILEELGRFLYKQDFPVSISLQRSTGVYTLHVIGAENTAKLVRKLEPHIRTEHKKEQIEEFKESLLKPRKLLLPNIRRARAILGLKPNM